MSHALTNNGMAQEEFMILTTLPWQIPFLLHVSMFTKIQQSMFKWKR